MGSKCFNAIKLHERKREKKSTLNCCLFYSLFCDVVSCMNLMNIFEDTLRACVIDDDA